MESELNFEWPATVGSGSPNAVPDEWRPLARRKRARPPEEVEPGGPAVDDQLDEARATIVRLEGDRRAARQRITELEAARDTLQDQVTAQRRLLLLLERQLESANLEPVSDACGTSWLDRLFGGLSSVPAG